MLEYNFWDDRTHDESYFCPIKNDYCYHPDECNDCQIMSDYDEYYERMNEENENETVRDDK